MRRLLEGDGGGNHGGGVYALGMGNGECGLWRCILEFWDNSEPEYCLGRGTDVGRIGEYEIQDDTECSLRIVPTGDRAGDRHIGVSECGGGSVIYGDARCSESEYGIRGVMALGTYDHDGMGTGE